MTYSEIAKALRRKMRGWKWCRDPQYGCFNCALWYARTVIEWAADCEEEGATELKVPLTK